MALGDFESSAQCAKPPDMVTIKNLSSLVKQLERKYGGWRELERACGVSYQTLQNWAKGGPRIKQMLDFIQWAKKDIEQKKNTSK